MASKVTSVSQLLKIRNHTELQKQGNPGKKKKRKKRK